MAEQKNENTNKENINNSIRTSVGRVIDIIFPSMVSSSGSDWFLSTLEGGLVLVDIRREYVSSDINGPSRDSFRFLAVESGSYKLAFNSLQMNSSSPSTRADRREVIQVNISDKDQSSAQDISSDLSNDKFVPISSIVEYQRPIVPYGFPNGLGDNIITFYGLPRPLYGICINPSPYYGVVPIYGIPVNGDQNGQVLPKYGIIKPLYGVPPIMPLYGIPPILPYGVPVPPVAVPPINNGGGLVIALYGVPVNNNGNI